MIDSAVIHALSCSVSPVDENGHLSTGRQGSSSRAGETGFCRPLKRDASEAPSPGKRLFLTRPSASRRRTNKSESFNHFVQWLLFGGDGEIAENDREKQRKIIKYNHLVANCLIFHNVHAQTLILHQVASEGVEFDRGALSRLSPYITAHVNRFGLYTLDLDRSVPEPDYSLDPLHAPRVAES